MGADLLPPSWTWMMSSFSKQRAETLALRGALHESRDVRELDRGADDLRGMVDRGELLETGVLDLDYGRIRLDRAERIVLGGGLLLLCERVEQCGLPDVGESYDTY